MPEIIRFIRPLDIADILIMTFLLYQLYSWFRNTKAMQVVMGLGFLGIVYVVTKNLGLFMTSWILQELGTVLFVLIIVLFQAEIRQALYRISLLRNFFGRQEASASIDLAEFSTAIFSLARTHTGALVVFQRQEPLDEYLVHGAPLDSLVSGQIIATIFHGNSPLHDGAIIIQNDRISQASCHLPLSSNPDLPRNFGTRHRAGIGITEKSDAIVVIVSEERGEVSLVDSGEVKRILTPEQLYDHLNIMLFSSVQETEKPSFRKRLFNNFWPKLMTFFLVTVCWLIITAKQGGIVTVTAPLNFHNLPDNLALVKNAPEEIEVQLKVFSSLIASPRNLDVVADLNLAGIKEGTSTLSINNSDIKIPLGVMITSVNPSTVRITTGKKVTKELRVRANVRGDNEEAVKRLRIKVEPSYVVVEGPEHVLRNMDSLYTEEIEYDSLRGSAALQKRLVNPAPQVRILRDEPVKVRVVRAAK